MNLNDTVRSAYKKFKSYIYEDNTLLHIRITLAEFEANGNIEEKLSNLEKLLGLLRTNTSAPDFDGLIEKINYILLPKKYQNKIENHDDKNMAIHYSNELKQDKYIIEDFNVFIDCPIEIHIISVLWIMHIGEKLDKNLHIPVCGYRVVRNSDGIFEKDGYKLFEKYHEKYSYFRDSAITKAIELHNVGLDATIINLDVKRFFYHIKFDFESVEAPNELKFLNTLMNRIHQKYQAKLKEDQICKKDADTIIPIGLLSSSIIANNALHDFDDFVYNQLRPEHYGRYVDDMLLVFSNKDFNSLSKFIKYSNCKSNGFSFNEEDGYIVFESNSNRFIFQQSKVKILEFKKDAPIALLNKFKSTIENNRSIFNFKPEEHNIFSTLEDASININYSSTINKISSIEKSSLDILSISRNLSQMIRIVLITNHKKEEIEKYNTQLEALFSGINLLELSRLWEKLFLYCVLSRSFGLIKKISIDILRTIDVVDYRKDGNDITNKIKSNLQRYFANSLLMSASVDIKTFNQSIQPHIETQAHTKDSSSNLYDRITKRYILEYADYLIQSNLIRQYYIRYPLLSYTNASDYSLIDYNLVLKKLKISIDDQKVEFSPRFLHFHEILLFKKFSSGNCKLNELFESYSKYNKLQPDISNYPQKKETDKNDLNLIVLNSSGKFTNLKIGMASLNVEPKNSLDSMQDKPNLSYKRLNEFYRILNAARATRCDMIVFPEISVPIYWLQEIVEFAKKNEIAVILGIEHFTINKRVYNYSVAVLPFKDGVYKNAYINFELKSHYSPAEKKLIEGHGYKTPLYRERKPKVLKWRDNYFSVFNCYELTDIGYRSSLVGKVDFVVAIEHNRDINYFSNIVGSVSRDIHAYVVQVNDAKYGDSRIIKPSKTEEMDIAKIKGGEDELLLTATIDVKSLREFQKKNHILQESDNRYKQTPPRFSEECLIERLG